MNLSRLILALTFAAAGFAAELDTGGNGWLRGDYFVREVIASDIATNIDVGRMQTIYGTITFDGSGGYQFRGSRVDSQSGNQPQNHTISGRYKVGGNGLAEIESLLGGDGETLFGSLGASALVASMTENTPQLHDVFIAIPAGSGVTNSVLQGKYLGGMIDVLGAQSRNLRTGLVQFDANGQGAMSNVTATGHARNLGQNTQTQTIDGATYNIGANGQGTLSLPLSGAAEQRLWGGQKIAYVSADGGLMLGGASNGHDIFVAFKAPENASNALYNGSYLSTSLYFDPGDDGVMWATYGSTRANGSGEDIAHERTNETGYDSYDIGFSVTVNIPASGVVEREQTRFAISREGRHLVWTGKGNQFSFVFLTKARDFSGDGVFLHPLGVTNAASFSPVTAAVAPGEFVTLFGSGLSNSTEVASGFPFPTSLGGVQVLVNGQPIALYAVSPTQVSGVLPYSVPSGDYAVFTVNNNGQSSNAVTQYTSAFSAGVFTNPANGLGVPAALHTDNSVVTPSNPARPGETISVYLTGLGAVSPGVEAGSAAPSNPLSHITADFINVQVDGQDANVSFAGLAPGLAGLYQINFTIPSGVQRGDAELWIDVPTSINSQTYLPVQ